MQFLLLMLEIKKINMKYRIEFIPRYGGELGIIWKDVSKDEVREDIMINTHGEEVIGSIKIKDDQEKELWTRLIQEINEIVSTKKT